MKSKELINKTFDKVISRIKKGESTEQVIDPEVVKKTDKNITEICKDKLK